MKRWKTITVETISDAEHVSWVGADNWRRLLPRYDHKWLARYHVDNKRLIRYCTAVHNRFIRNIHQSFSNGHYYLQQQKTNQTKFYHKKDIQKYLWHHMQIVQLTVVVVICQMYIFCHAPNMFNLLTCPALPRLLQFIYYTTSNSLKNHKSVHLIVLDFTKSIWYS